MNQHLVDELKKDFGRLFCKISFVECDDGWYSLLRRLAADLKEADPEVVAHQVKEKFGGLRFYVGPANDAAYEAIDRAEEESLRTCEMCGEPGEMTNRNYWVKTLCDKCHGESLCPNC